MTVLNWTFLRENTVCNKGWNILSICSYSMIYNSLSALKPWMQRLCHLYIFGSILMIHCLFFLFFSISLNYKVKQKKLSSPVSGILNHIPIFNTDKEPRHRRVISSRMGLKPRGHTQGRQSAASRQKVKTPGEGSWFKLDCFRPRQDGS